MASLFGARLMRFGGAVVTLTGSWPVAIASIGSQGVSVEEPTGQWTAHPRIEPLGGPHAPADFVLVLVKSHQTAAVAPVVARALASTGLAVTLQNGIGNAELLLQATGPGRVSVGVATVGATLVGPGHVRATPGSVVLGAGPSVSPALQRFVELLTESGFETRLDADIDRALWRKLAVNCAINALSALNGCPNGGLLDDPALCETLVQAAREVGAVAAAKDISFDVDPAALALAVAEKTATNRSSMLQDVERGAATEIEALNGAVVREARRLGVPAPVNESLWQAIVNRTTGGLPGDIA